MAAALANRVLRAHDNKEQFQVYIVLPLYPGKGQCTKMLGNEGDIIDARGSALVRVLLRYEYLTISRGQDSLIGRLKKEGVDPNDYIMICGLRNHGKARNTPLSELIYVHSKLIIADDKYALIGSANINDRSLIGFRDSELAVLLTGKICRLLLKIRLKWTR